MSVEELNALERYLEIWMFNIRSAKVTGRKPINYR
jgi:ribosomal protein L29